MATLTPPSPEHADQIPSYDALRIFADSSAPEPPVDGSATDETPADDQFYGAEVDGEVSVKVSDFPLGPIEKNPRVVMAAQDVEAIVRASANFGGGETDMAALSFIDPGGSGDDFAMTEEDPFAAMGVKIETENVSNVAKSEETATGLRTATSG